MTTEVRTITVIDLVRTIGGQQFDIIDLSLVARNTKAQLLRTMISVNTSGALTAASQFLLMVIPWQIPRAGIAFSAISEVLNALNPLAVVMDGHNVVGTPTNNTQQMPSAEIEIDFSKILRRGVAVISKGTRSNNRAGWSILIINLQAGSMDVDLAITAEQADEWLGGSGSKKNLDFENSEFDEGENLD